MLRSMAGCVNRWLLAGAMLPLALQAQTADDLERCRSIPEPSARLACYDAAAAAAAARAGSKVPDSSAAASVPAVDEGRRAPGAQLVATGSLEGDQSLIAQRWELEDRYKAGTFRFTFYRPNYILPAVWSTNVNDAPSTPTQPTYVPPGPLDQTEAEFQLSFKLKLWQDILGGRSALWLGYTQRSFWQIYNEDLSRPFRETNYEPEIFVSYNPALSFAGLDWRLLNLGYNHQSNGRSDPISRSWDRVIAELGIERGDFAVLIRPWVVIDEGGNDNPDITDYMGWGDVTATYKWEGHSFTLMGRGNPDTGKGTVQFTWMSPPVLGPLRAYVEAFSGYGDSLIDYNWYQNTIGIGVSLNDYLDRPGRP